jgi:uncharacterized protein
MITLDLTPFKPGLHSVTLSPEPEDLELEDEVFSDVTVDVRLEVGHESVIVMLEARATAALVCDRTLEPFAQPVSGSHAVLFLPEERLGSGAETDDVRPLPDPGAPLDLTAPVRDTLVLAIPVRRIAPGGEDREIPLVFGADADGIDPRWEALRRLRDAS